MSPTKRASTVAGLRRGVGQAPAAEVPAAVVAQSAPRMAPVKPVRVTLNFPPELFRQLDHWCADAADAIGVPRVGIQDALRTMVRIMTDESYPASAKVRAELQRKG